MTIQNFSPQFLDILRCPLDPAHTRLEPSPSHDGLVCQRCRLVYPVREGIPCLLPEEAALPPGCDSLSALPCRQAPAPTGAQP
jgi:uncharacterized protein YbaR (Trm112 family)